LGPFIAVSTKKKWALSIVDENGVWKRVTVELSRSPRWLHSFSWCIFLNKADNYINDLRILKSTLSVPACKPIFGINAEKIISNLIQDEYLPNSQVGSYRTLRGVWVRSRAEYMIDNWFAEHGIVTYYERTMYINSICIVPDWYVPSLDTYVEFLGLKGDLEYEKIWNMKEKLYIKYNVKYVVLTDQDLSDLDRSIPRKLPLLKEKGIQ
jgi:hypothetical protein